MYKIGLGQSHLPDARFPDNNIPIDVWPTGEYLDESFFRNSIARKSFPEWCDFPEGPLY